MRPGPQLKKENLRSQTETRPLSLCGAADVNRSTFYNYYSSPSDLLREIEQDVLDRIPASPPVLDQRGEETLLQATTDFFDYVKENERVFRVLFSKSANDDFSSRLEDLLCSQHIPSIDNVDVLSSRFMQRYVANGTVGMLREWLASDFPVSSREIAEMMYFFSRKVTG